VAINLVSNAFDGLTSGVPVQVLPAGNYRLQEINVGIAGLNFAASGTFELQMTLSSGSNPFYYIDQIGNAPAAEWVGQNLNLIRVYVDPLILTPNTPIFLNVLEMFNINNIVLSINLSGTQNSFVNTLS
jgi:hypothetical protein